MNRRWLQILGLLFTLTLLSLGGCVFSTGQQPVSEVFWVESGDSVNIKLNHVAVNVDHAARQWVQVSGNTLRLIGNHGEKINFIAPEVHVKTTFIFEYVLFNEFRQDSRAIKDRITVIVEPVLIVNNLRLPPNPILEDNNATVLGVDLNTNGVRDDVERYIYQRYPNAFNFAKTKTAIAMQYAAAYQTILGHDASLTYAFETYLEEDDILDCQRFFFNEISKDKPAVEGLYFVMQNKIIDDEFEAILFNTQPRKDARMAYRHALDDLIEGSVRPHGSKEKCHFDIVGLGEI